MHREVEPVDAVITTNNSLETLVNQESKYVDDWLGANELSLNIQWSHEFYYLPPFSEKKNPAKTTLLKLHQTQIKQKDHIKHLGVVIDAEHIHQINKKISQ